MKKLLAGVSLVAVMALGTASVTGAAFAFGAETTKPAVVLTEKQKEVKDKLVALEKEKAAALASGDAAKVASINAEIASVKQESGLTDAQLAEVAAAVQEAQIEETEKAENENQNSQPGNTDSTPGATDGEGGEGGVDLPDPVLPGDY